MFEASGEAGERDLALLVSEVALGYEHEAVVLAKGGERFGDALEQLDRVAEHFLAKIDDAAQLVGADGSLGELDGGFDAGQHEALDAVAVELEVSHLRAVEGAFDRFGVVELGK